MNETHKKILKLLVLASLFIFLFQVMQNVNKTKSVNTIAAPEYSEFLKQVENGNVKKVTIIEKARGAKEVTATNDKDQSYKIYAPADESLIKTLKDNKVVIKADKEEEGSLLLNILISWFPMFLLIGVWIYFMRKSSGKGGGIFGMGKSKTRVISPANINVTFADVVGADEAKEEVKEVIDFLKNKDKFSRLGGRIPKGILLTGPAGTGKTMLAKAIAKEAGVPFFANSGSDFVEMFVGLGAARVRDMFTEARKAAPCILFIDEIDALGGKRGMGGVGGGHDEREQTLNQLLVEMDGVESTGGVIVIGATNRADVLDPALLRPGRLDRHVIVSLPDVRGREQILKVHINSKQVPTDVALDLTKIAKGTSGFSGAELENLVNEAAIMAARQSKPFVTQVDFEMAKDKIIMGPERRSMVMPEKEKINTAYHESGHAVVAKLIKNTDPVHKVTIIPRGRALGVTMQLPEEDRYAHDKDYLLARIAVLMGGRLGEELFLNHMTTGASNDISVATSMARKMVTEWGMSELGMISFGEQVGGAWAGQSSMANLSQETIREVDQQIKKIITEQYNIAKDILDKNRDKVEAMSKALLEVETIDDWQIDNIMAGRPFNWSDLGEAAQIAQKNDVVQVIGSDLNNAVTDAQQDEPKSGNIPEVLIVDKN